MKCLFFIVLNLIFNLNIVTPTQLLCNTGCAVSAKCELTHQIDSFEGFPAQ